MKQFRFSLETVLDYKQKAMDSLQIEYGLLLSKVHQQEEVLEKARQRYRKTNEEFRERKLHGLTIAGAISYEVGLSVLEQEIRKEEESLHALKLQETELHAKLIESKIDTSSLELLRDKKFQNYQQAVQKMDEQLIDELFAFSRDNATSFS